MLIKVINAICRMVYVIVWYFIDLTVAADIRPNYLGFVFLLAVLTVLLWSACWSASIAERRWHSPALHFALGVVVPVVYPIILVFTMDVRGARQRAELRIREEEEQAEGAPLERARRRAAETPDRVDEAFIGPGGVVFNRDYFRRLAIDEEGRPTGPWLITFGDSDVVAERIVDSLDHAVVVEVRGDEGALDKIRVPYAKIRGCDPA